MIDNNSALFNHGVRLRRGALWLLGALLLLMSAATAALPGDAVRAPVVVNSYGMTAPFLASWASVWFFGLAGGIGACFFKIDAIDKNFRFLFAAKPFLGLFGSLALCLFVSGDADPPPITLSAYAFFASLLSAPILQALLAVASLKQNQAELFNKINPFKFKVVVPDRDDKDGTP